MIYIIQALIVSFLLLLSLRAWEDKNNIIYKAQKITSYIIITLATTGSILINMLV